MLSLYRIAVIGVVVLSCGHLAVASDAESKQLSQATKTNSAASSEILWDEFGIPHIYGQDLLTVIRGYGYAQMENHAELILKKAAESRGRTSEYFGAGAQNVNVQNDIRTRTFGISQRSECWYRDGGAFQRLVLQAFADGINAYAQQHGDTIDPQLQQVLPFTPEDELSILQNTLQFTFMFEISQVTNELAAWQQNPTAASIKPKGQQTLVGSNAWALAPQRSTDGNPILMGNPHMPWGVNQPAQGLEFYQWFEANLVVGDPNHPLLNASGVTFPGLPFIGIGFNDDLGWSHTVNTIKNADLYELTLQNGGYLFDGSVRQFEKRTDSIKIKQADGTFVTQAFDVLSSVHGPVVATSGAKALALKVAGLNSPALVTEYWQMMLSHTLEEFTVANSALQVPIFNVVYADRKGNTMYVFGGQQPVRNGGTFQDWAGILPGNTSSTLWTNVLNWLQLPKAIDPPGGYVSNSNEAPWLATFPQTILAKNYPGYIAQDTSFFRPEASSLFFQSQPKFSVSDVLNTKQSTRMLFADRVLPDLLTAARASQDQTALAAADVLANWSRTSDAEAKGAVLFELWYQSYLTDTSSTRSTSWGPTYPAFRIEWSDSTPLTTPIGLADSQSSVRALIAAAKQAQSVYGSLDVAFGDVNRVVLADHDKTFQNSIPITNLPGSGSGDPFGGIRALYFIPSPDPTKNIAYDGDGYIQLVEFTSKGAQARGLLTYGNASRPGSSHIADQIPLFQAKELRDIYRNRVDVQAHTEKRELY